MIYVLILVVFGVMIFPDYADALVVGVPIVAVSLIHIIGLVISVLAVPLAFLVRMFKKDWRRSIVITLVILAIITLTIGVLAKIVGSDLLLNSRSLNEQMTRNDSAVDAGFRPQVQTQDVLWQLLKIFVVDTSALTVALFVPVFAVYFIYVHFGKRRVELKRVVTISFLISFVIGALGITALLVYATVGLR
ncbi:hypothetical protein KC614_00045 [candidate division WWE3 bacterium]|uniref:Uncharacterized protein n=1 Tax=candidate division WWE3 bacterium TaxID=2053526 RepID=A0A955LJJ8_UNCKA|nr:hypothetical protein [candidate division WWE3 bacterium]